MTKIHSFLNRFQLQYRRTSTLNKVVIAAAVVLSSLTLLSLRLVRVEAEETLADLRQQAAILDQRNEELRRDIDELGTTDSVRKIAQEELGLVDPDTIIFENAD
jgi:cell division protein FtsB